MADQARAAGRERPPQSPQNIKVVRSQKIAPVSPADSRPPPPPADLYDAEDGAQDRAPPIPRSHTPGHLSSKSQDRRNRPADLTLRQRSQSSAAAITPSSSSSALLPPSLPTSAASFSATSTTKAPTPTLLTRQPIIAEDEDAAITPGHDRQDPSSAGSNKDPPRRPPALRSTSAIAGRPGPGNGGNGGNGSAVPGTITRVGTGRGALVKGAEVHTSFPALADPSTAADVPAAPSSGMYWSRAPASGAPHTALRAHTTTLVGSNAYVFGGCDARACFNALYVLDADAFHWSAPHVVGDVPVPLRAMTCTAVGKKLVIFGGGDGPAYYNDVYVLDTVNFRWSRPRILGDKVPSKRRAHTACLYKNGIYVFGGGDGVRALNDIWRLDVSDMAKMSWKLISGPSSVDGKSPVTGRDLRPKARGYHTANMVGSKLIIYGGSDGGECFNDVWVYDVETHVWKSVSIPVTYRRLSHTATIVGSYLFVIGGHDGNEYSNDVLLLNLVTMAWDRRKVYGLPPSGRGYHGTVLHDSRLLMIGGFDGSEVFGDVWSLELAVHAYYSQISHFTIEV
ncbi:Tip elongation aberrant protein 1 [Parachaetomium inaequale]|uniref:Tip elongation aberrant protein 1 n=1 Tax=Parachaetomium inaequale TaxID=2588326 RepID=A0AAN6SUH5_9PEZI|nr:Tip elongation aberrant protein 1 [Parachaetomium inaequale]